jgi:hypothetical protein
LPDYGALEPFISDEIMKIHHTKHHQVCTGTDRALGMKICSESLRVFCRCLSLGLLEHSRCLAAPPALLPSPLGDVTNLERSLEKYHEKYQRALAAGNIGEMISLQLAGDPLQRRRARQPQHLLAEPRARWQGRPAGELTSAIDKRWGSFAAWKLGPGRIVGRPWPRLGLSFIVLRLPRRIRAS